MTIPPETIVLGLLLVVLFSYRRGVRANLGIRNILLPMWYPEPTLTYISYSTTRPVCFTWMTCVSLSAPHPQLRACHHVPPRRRLQALHHLLARRQPPPSHHLLARRQPPPSHQLPARRQARPRPRLRRLAPRWRPAQAPIEQ